MIRTKSGLLWRVQQFSVRRDNPLIKCLINCFELACLGLIVESFSGFRNKNYKFYFLGLGEKLGRFVKTKLRTYEDAVRC